MTKKEIIDIVQSLDHDAAYRTYYNFAHNYIQHMLNSGVTETKFFWDVVRHCHKTAESSNTKKALGISGKGRPEEIKRWCEHLLNNDFLKNAAPGDLCSIFGYCAHLGK